MKVDAYNAMDAYDATDTSQNAVKIGIPKITTGTVLLLHCLELPIDADRIENGTDPGLQVIIVDTLTFMSRKNSILGLFEPKN